MATDIEKLRAAVVEAKEAKEAATKASEEEAKLLEEAKELGIDISKYVKEEKKSETPEVKTAEGVDKEQKKTEKEDGKIISTNDPIKEASESIAKAVSEAIKSSTKEESKDKEVVPIYG